jgi:small subunit ribosomal protein S14
MATSRMKARERRRSKLVQKAWEKRAELRQLTKKQDVSYEEKKAAVDKLAQSKRDESSIRRRSRCRFCGRSRAIYSKFGLCRIHLREAVMRGEVPGLVKASW